MSTTPKTWRNNKMALRLLKELIGAIRRDRVQAQAAAMAYSFFLALPAVLPATAGWLLSTVAFGVYVNHISSYDRIYGSLGAVIALLTWIWLSSVTFLIGAEINSLLAAKDGR